MPKEYLKELFDECIGRKNKKIDKHYNISDGSILSIILLLFCYSL